MLYFGLESLPILIGLQLHPGATILFKMPNRLSLAIISFVSPLKQKGAIRGLPQIEILVIAWIAMFGFAAASIMEIGIQLCIKAAKLGAGATAMT